MQIMRKKSFVGDSFLILAATNFLVKDEYRVSEKP